MKQQLIKNLVSNYKKTLNPSSKWFTQDVQDFASRVSKLSVKEMEIKLGRISSLVDDNSLFNKKVKKEINFMAKGGMFNVSEMKPANCMD
jgi:hypothetical protein